MSVIVNRRDLDFQLYELEGIQSLFQDARFEHLDRGSLESMLDLAEALAEEFFLPAAAVLDAQEPLVQQFHLNREARFEALDPIQRTRHPVERVR